MTHIPWDDLWIEMKLTLTLDLFPIFIFGTERSHFKKSLLSSIEKERIPQILPEGRYTFITFFLYYPTFYNRTKDLFFFFVQSLQLM